MELTGCKLIEYVPHEANWSVDDTRMSEKIEVLSAGAVQQGLVKVIDAFRRETGYGVNLAFATAPEIRKRLGGGELAEVVIAPLNLIDEIVKTGKAVTAPLTVGRIGVGVMVRDGVPLPNIPTVEKFTQSLLAADSVVYNQASTGVYLESLFDQLGIASQLQAKTTRYPDFAAVRDHVSKGSGNEIGLGATTVIIESAGKGVKFAGALPAKIQNYTTYAAVVVEHSSANEAAHSLINYLANPTAKAIFRSTGIE